MRIDTTLLNSLAENGWACSDIALPSGFAEELRNEAEHLWLQNCFRPARIGKGANKTLHAEIRGDSIAWLPTEEMPPGVAAFLAWAEEYRHELNQHFFLGLNSTEFHFARYPENKGYRKHLDQSPGTTERKISLVLYLNPGWKEI